MSKQATKTLNKRIKQSQKDVAAFISEKLHYAAEAGLLESTDDILFIVSDAIGEMLEAVEEQ